MIRSILRNYSLTKNAGSKRIDRISTFYKLSLLDFKIAFMSKKSVQCSAHFFGYKVHASSYFLMNYLFKEVFLSKEYFFHARNQNPFIIDCGANIGMSVLYFKKLYPHSKILAFEANSDVFNLLKKNVTSNHLTNVEMHNIALSDHDGEVSFYISDVPGTLLGSMIAERGGDIEIRCTAKKLSTFIKDAETIDLLKIDIEGSEWAVICDLIEAMMLKKVDQCIVEYHHNMKENVSHFSEFLAKFERNGFGYNIKAAFGKVGGFQDILIHFYRQQVW